MPRLTVIMPAHNAKSTVAAAVRSTLRALPADSELLLLDDASTDGTVAQAEAAGDARVRIMQSTVNLGVSRALNVLLEHVDSEFVARMDADDICLPWRLHQQLRALRSSAEVVFTTVTQFSRLPLRIRPLPPVPISPAAMRLHLLLANPVAHSTMAAQTEHVNRVGGYRSVQSEDYDLWLRMCVDGSRLARVGTPGLLYRLHAGQVTSAAGWHEASAADAALRESYEALCAQVDGDEAPSWYRALRGRVHGAPREPNPDLARLSGLLEDQSELLSARERRFLLAKRDRLLGSVR